MPRLSIRVLLGLLGAVFALGASPAAAQVPSLSDRKHQIDDRIAGLEQEVEQAKEREQVLSSEIESASSEIETLEGKIGVLSERVAKLESDLARHRDRLARLEALFRDQSQLLRRLVRQHAVAQRRLEARLVELYQAGDTDAVEILLQVQDLNDLIDQLDYFTQVARQDISIAAELKRVKREMRLARAKTRTTKVKVAEATAVLARKTAEERAAKDSLVAQQSALQAARSDRRDLLVSVRAERHEAEEDLEARQAASSALAAKIQAAQAAAPPPTTSAPADTTASSSGFVWPVSGPVTSVFGWRWGRMHEGIDISAPAGTPVGAAASGTVIYAGWMGGYGNLVVIDHGGGLATAYAHLSAIYAGGAVSQGQAIGAVGSTGFSTGNHLHFEVRVNGAAVDPFGYL